MWSRDLTTDISLILRYLTTVRHVRVHIFHACVLESAIAVSRIRGRDVDGGVTRVGCAALIERKAKRGRAGNVARDDIVGSGSGDEVWIKTQLAAIHDVADAPRDVADYKRTALGLDPFLVAVGQENIPVIAADAGRGDLDN